ncbi:MAG: hypothetical protein JW727_00630 [Candidatus Aenigmarchaeota archaeon]|nr:hypothetical protein [Candidatus Aenigmarchaeota archaeon]
MAEKRGFGKTETRIIESTLSAYQSKKPCLSRVEEKGAYTSNLKEVRKISTLSASKEISRQKLKLKKFLEKAESGYDREISHFLRELIRAEKSGNIQKLRAGRELSDAWARYFTAFESGLKGKKTDPKVREFAKSQVLFFNTLSESITSALNSAKSGSMRKVLE